MNDFYNPTKRIKVCTGPNCKAWQSKKVLSLISKDKEKSISYENIQVGPVACMKKCGGGVTVKMSANGKLLKWREPEEALVALNK